MAVAALDAAGSLISSNNLAYTIGSGVNRVLIVVVCQEVASSTQLAVAYGGESMTAIVGIAAVDTLDARVDLYYLNNAGIEAASGNFVNLTSPPTDYIIIARSYKGARQTAPTVIDSESALGDLDPLTNIQISSEKGSAVIGAGFTGIVETGVTWAGTNPLTAVLDVGDGTMHGAFGERFSTGTETVNHNLTFNEAVNRVVGVALKLFAAALIDGVSVSKLGGSFFTTIDGVAV